jgi:Tol biopolymer transport system component
LAATILEHGVSDLWLGDLSRGTLTRLTDAGMNVEPVWRPGCQTILFGSSREGVVNIYEAAASGEAVRRVHRSDRVQVPTSIAPDGRLFLTEVAPATRADIWRLDPGGRAHALFTSPAVETAARISPDGRWLAYQVDDRNGSQVFVTAVSGSGSRVPVSTGSAFAPSWSSDGRRLYWRQGGTEVMAVEISGTSAPIIGPMASVLRHPDLAGFKATSDGLVVLLGMKEHLPLTRLLLVLNWRQELARRLAGAR